jgi:hypothetical protein
VRASKSSAVLGLPGEALKGSRVIIFGRNYYPRGGLYEGVILLKLIISLLSNSKVQLEYCAKFFAIPMKMNYTYL